jgi:tungstate transport system ATP-binding protein
MNKAYQLNNIHYSYDEKFSLFLPKLDISAQKITALIGANGSGKSTLLSLLGLLVSPKIGSLTFFGEIVTLKQQQNLRKQIGFLAQKPYMFRGSVIDNLNLVLKIYHFPKKQREKKINLILEQLEIIELSKQQAKTLSGGELQKVALARALIMQPKILLMDEPFSYLDLPSIQLLERFILDYVTRMKTTLVFSTHDRLQGLAIADDVISLVKGKQIKSPLVNLFKGHFEGEIFKTAYLSIFSVTYIKLASHVSIDPREIVLSRQCLNSSMRNQYQGRVIAIVEESDIIRVSIDARDIFQVMITKSALKLLALRLGDIIWLSFKANSVVIF